MSKAEAREAMIKKRFGGNASGASGGSGNARRKKKSAAKVSGADDKKVSTHLKKLNPQVIPGIEEVNIFTDTGDVIHFVQPKIQAAVAHKTFIISGAKARNLQIWDRNLVTDALVMKLWLENRIAYITNYINNL